MGRTVPTSPRKAVLVHLNHHDVSVLPRQGSVIAVRPAGQVDLLTRIREDHVAVGRRCTAEKYCCEIAEISFLNQTNCTFEILDT